MKANFGFENGQFKLDTDIGEKINWTLLFQIVLGLGIFRAAWNPDLFITALEQMLERASIELQGLAHWLSGIPFPDLTDARAWVRRWAQNISRALWLVLGLLAISLILYALGDPWWLVVSFLAFIGFFPFIFVLAFSGRVFRIIISPLALFLCFAMLLAAAATTFPTSSGVPVSTRIVWGLMVLLPPIGIAALGKRGTLLGVIFAILAIAYMTVQISTPPYARRSVQKGWQNNTGFVAAGGGTLFYLNGTTPTYATIPSGAKIKMNDKKPKDFNTTLVNTFLLETKTLREVYVIESPTLVGTKGLMDANETWQQGVSFWETLWRTLWPFGGSKPQPAQTAATAGGGPTAGSPLRPHIEVSVGWNLGKGTVWQQVKSGAIQELYSITAPNAKDPKDGRTEQSFAIRGVPETLPAPQDLMVLFYFWDSGVKDWVAFRSGPGIHVGNGMGHKIGSYSNSAGQRVAVKFEWPTP